MSGDALTNAMSKKEVVFEKPTCRTCKFFEEGDNTCRINPVTVYLQEVYLQTEKVKDVVEMNTISGWPVTDPDKGWCSQHRKGWK